MINAVTEPSLNDDVPKAEVATRNRFQDLSATDICSPENVKALNAWGANVRITSSGMQSQRKKNKMIVAKSDKDMDRAMDTISALPTYKKGLIKAARKVMIHNKIELDNHEILAMIDSGSFTHAANAEKTLPFHKIKPPRIRDLRRKAETACGGILEVKGSIDVDGEVDGQKLGINFKHMDVN